MSIAAADRRWISWLTKVLVLTACLAGCGLQDGPTRYRVRGQVTFDGKPVPLGFVTLEPDDTQGNSGPGAGAPIVNGTYDTGVSNGVVGGPFKVRIVGFDGVPFSEGGEQLPDGQQLFEPYDTTIEFPKEATEKNFEVPKVTP